MPLMLQLVWRRKPRDTIYVRAAPYTIIHPTHAQRESQRAFAEAARLARGKKGLAPDGLPWAAHYVKMLLTGYKTGLAREKPRLWEEQLRLYTRLRGIVASIAAAEATGERGRGEGREARIR